MPIGRGTFALVYEVADDHGNDEIAPLRDDDALCVANVAVRELVAIEARAAGQGSDAHGDALPGRHEVFVQQVDVGDAVDLIVGDDAGVAIAAEAELWSHVDFERAAAPTAALRPGVARERPGAWPP